MKVSELIPNAGNFVVFCPALAVITRRHPETLRRLGRMGRLPGLYGISGRWMIAREAADVLRHFPKGVGE